MSVSILASSYDGILAFGKPARTAPSLSSLPPVVLERVPMFIWLNKDCSRPRREQSRPSSLEETSAVMLWPALAQKIPLDSEHRCPAKLQISCDVHCAYSPVYLFIPCDSPVVRAVVHSGLCSRRLYMAAWRSGLSTWLALCSCFNRVCKNDGLSDLCVILGGQPRYYMCDSFYFHCQTGRGDSVGTTVFEYSHSALSDFELLSRVFPGDWAICVLHDVMGLSAGFDGHLYVWFFPSWSFKQSCVQIFLQQSLLVPFELILALPLSLVCLCKVRLYTC